jgi:hypothetical protein
MLFVAVSIWNIQFNGSLVFLSTCGASCVHIAKNRALSLRSSGMGYHVMWRCVPVIFQNTGTAELCCTVSCPSRLWAQCSLLDEPRVSHEKRIFAFQAPESLQGWSASWRMTSDYFLENDLVWSETSRIRQNVHTMCVCCQQLREVSVDKERSDGFNTVFNKSIYSIMDRNDVQGLIWQWMIVI